MREHDVEAAPEAPVRRAGGAAPAATMASALGNRGMAALASGAAPPAGSRGMGAGLQRLVSTSPPSTTSPPNMERPEEAAPIEGLELTTPPPPTVPGTPAPAPPTAPPAPAVAVQNPTSLTIKGSGTIEGAYGISQYWPVTSYWGADKTLGVFDEPVTGSPGWRMKGHKFQVVGEFTSGTTNTGAGGNVQFLQEARITTTKGGTPGAWFNDMDYTDAAGGAHQWDPNAESGTTGTSGYTGVRRTIATNKYAYTDPPAIGYKPKVGTAAGSNDYRKLEFRIKLIAPPGSTGSTITKTATQEIEVVDGTVTVHQAP